MTEDEWLKRDSWPEGLLRELHTVMTKGEAKVSDRMLRLFRCACCRHVENFVGDEPARRTISVVERHVDGLALDEELQAAGDAIERAVHESYEEACRTLPVDATVWLSAPIPSLHLLEAVAHAAGRTPGSILMGGWIALAMNVAMKCRLAVTHAASEFGKDDKFVTQAALRTHLTLLRDCLGNPFRPISLNTACLEWNDGIIPKLAQSIYEERAFERMPILADALEEAGCTDADILNHCRHQGEHVRGCWVVDLMLGKEQTYIDLSTIKQFNADQFRSAVSQFGDLEA